MVGTKGVAAKTASEYAGQLTALLKRREESENRRRLLKKEQQQEEKDNNDNSGGGMGLYDPEETDRVICQTIEEEVFRSFKCKCTGDFTTQFEFECSKMTTSATGDFKDGALSSLTLCSDACPENLGLSD